jgi:hypothetical protein
MNSDLQEIIDDAKKVKASFRSQREKLEADKSLSDFGKKEQINALREKTNDKIEKLRSSYEKTKGALIDKLVGSLFGIWGISNESVSQIAMIEMNFRDALEKAQNLKGADELLKTLGRAKVAGDDSMRRAIGLVGLEAGFHSVCEAAILNDETKKLEQLWELTDRKTPQQKLQFNSIFGFIS